MSILEHEKQSIIVNLSELRCPITLERYTETNYPIALPCKHTISLQGFESIKSSKPQCPSCSQPFSPTYSPEKKNLFPILKDQQRTVFCRYHNGAEAVAFFTEERTFICLDCLCKEEGSKGRKIPLEQFECYLKSSEENITAVSRRQSEIRLEGALEERIAGKISQEMKSYIMKLVRLELENESKMAQGRRESVFCSERGDKIIARIMEKFKKAFGFDKEDVELTVKKKEAEAIKITLKNDLEVLNQIENYSCTKLGIDIKSGFKDVEVLCFKLAQLTNLKELVIQGMHNKQKFSDQDLGYLCAALGRLKELSFLKLDFKSCKYLSDNGMKELSLYLKECEGLTSLNLNFNLCENLGDQGLKEIIKGLKEKIDIVDLNLNWSWCSGITENGVNELNSLVKSMENLKDLKVNFYGCKEIKQEGLSNLNALKKNENFSMILPLHIQQK